MKVLDSGRRLICAHFCFTPDIQKHLTNKNKLKFHIYFNINFSLCLATVLQAGNCVLCWRNKSKQCEINSLNDSDKLSICEMIEYLRFTKKINKKFHLINFDLFTYQLYLNIQSSSMYGAFHALFLILDVRKINRYQFC